MTLRAIGTRRAFLHPAEFLEVLGPDALEPLVPAATLAAITPFARSVPVEVQTFCFECRLAPEDPRVDWAVLLFPEVDVEPLFEGIPAEATASWRPVVDFLRTWKAGRAGWSLQIPFVCMAFDRDEPHACLPVPCLSFCVDPAFFARRLGLGDCGAPDPAQVSDFASSIFSDFTGQRLPEPALARLRRCLAQEGAHARHLSLMLGRRFAPLKLDIELDLDHLPEVLRAISWPTPVDELVSTVRDYVPWARRIQLNVTLFPETGATLEVEIFSSRTHGEPEKRLGLLERLVMEGKAEAQKAAVLRRCLEVPALRTPTGVLGTSFYLKLRFLGGELSDAKAYLGLMPRPFQFGGDRPSSTNELDHAV